MTRRAGLVLVFWALACGGGQAAVSEVAGTATPPPPAPKAKPTVATKTPDPVYATGWEHPTSATFEGAWTRYEYASDDVAGARAAFENEGTSVVSYRTADTTWFLDTGAEAVRVTSEGGHVVVRRASWDAVPEEMPKDAFCPDPGRPDFRYADDGAVREKACIPVGKLDRDGPYQALHGDRVVVTGQYAHGGPDGPFVVTADDGSPLASGSFADHAPDGVWSYTSPGVPAEVRWARGKPSPAALDGIAGDGVGVTGLLAASRLEVLDIDYDRGVVAWKQTFVPERSDLEIGTRKCAYPGVDDEEAGVELGLTDLGTGETKTWVVYDSVAEDQPCTTEEAAKVQLDAAKAAFASANLDLTRRPAALPRDASGGVSVAGHTLATSTTEEPPDPVLAFGTPWIAGQAPYDPLTGGGFDAHQYFGTLSIDGRPAFLAYASIYKLCAGSGSLDWPAVYSDGASRVLALYVVTRINCDGVTTSYAFSPVLTVPS